MTATHITSLQNPRIKNIVKLHNRRQRDRQQLTVVEGTREIGRALANGFIPREAYVCPDLAQSAEATAVIDHLHQQIQTKLFTVTSDVFAKIAVRGESGGALLLLPYWKRPLDSLPLSPIPFFLIVEGGEKPGNLGAILRTADAAGVDAVIIADNENQRGTDLFNPNVVRASLGALFTVPTVTAATKNLIPWLQEHTIQIGAATPTEDVLYTAVNLNQPLALVLGSEAFGLSQRWLDAADLQMGIPMHGQIDSLNLSVATAVLLYEVVRQRGGRLNET
ncbi:MAG: RNA methyltransferase [Chloroflexi bacterium]|nr:RNA methyltransferase [Chloroflexota bacterium]